MPVETITKEDFEKGLNEIEERLEKRLDELEKRLERNLEKRLDTSFEKKMRHILTEELPIVLMQKFVSKDGLREAVANL